MSRKSVETLAKEVLANKWGVGKDRERRLTAKGYDYGKVQKRVNELYSADSTADKNISSNGVVLIKSFEGFSRVACKALPSEKYLTIGFNDEVLKGLSADIAAAKTEVTSGDNIKVTESKAEDGHTIYEISGLSVPDAVDIVSSVQRESARSAV